MRKPKPIEFNIGDIVQSKRNPTKGETYLIVDKLERGHLDTYHVYIGLSFQRGQTYSICRNITTQHWRILA